MGWDGLGGSGGYQWRYSLRICISCGMVRTNNPTLEASNTFGWQPQVQHAAHTDTDSKGLEGRQGQRHREGLGVAQGATDRVRVGAGSFRAAT